jgi:hypothetical protein
MVFGGGEVALDVEGVDEGPLAKLFGEGPPKKSVLAEVMLVKSPKMVKPLMPKSLAAKSM